MFLEFFFGQFFLQTYSGRILSSNIFLVECSLGRFFHHMYFGEGSFVFLSRLIQTDSDSLYVLFLFASESE